MSGLLQSTQASPSPGTRTTPLRCQPVWPPERAGSFSGLGVSVTGALISGLGNLALNLYLTPKWGISGAGVSLVGAYLIAIVWYWARMPLAKEQPAQ